VGVAGDWACAGLVGGGQGTFLPQKRVVERPYPLPAPRGVSERLFAAGAASPFRL
jgi:hypothetical protein